MRFKLKKNPRRGDTKTKIKFALFPKLCGTLDGGTWVWLEKYKVNYVYESRYLAGTTWHVDSYELL